MDTTSPSPLMGPEAVTDDQRIGRMVTTLLSVQGVKKQDLAERIGMTPANLSKKLGGATWSGTEVKQAAAALGVPVSLLYLDPSEVMGVLTTPGSALNYRSA